MEGSRATIAPDQQARIQQAAKELSQKREAEESAVRKRQQPVSSVPASNRNSVFTLGPNKEEFSPALAWAKKYDKEAIRAQYLGDNLAGKGSREMLTLPSEGLGINRSTSTLSHHETKELPPPPREERPKTEWPSAAPVTSSEPMPEPPAIVEPERAPTPPEPTMPVQAEAAEEAAKQPLPRTDSEVNVQRPASSTNKLRKSYEGHRLSPEEGKRSRKVGPPPTQKTTGIRRLFGTKRTKSKGTEVKPQADQENVNPAILAARRALEGKPSLAPAGSTDSPPLSPGHFQRMKQVPMGKSAPLKEEQPRPITPEEQRAPSPAPESVPQRTASEDNMYAGPPRTRRDEEYDQLSRVDTNEREDADREFSTFDQGPLSDQPAFVPEDSPEKDSFPRNEPKFRANHQSAYSAMTVPEEESEEDEPAAPVQNASDRWAQIRKNAADRARQSEEHTTRSRTETRTDDGETSGEETIESRVARIKARVAELTGNMEATRR